MLRFKLIIPIGRLNK